MANWKYVTGSVVNGITIASVANEQTKPSNACYIAKWGNNTTGNGSRDRPYLTITFAYSTIGVNVSQIFVIGSGVYRGESINIAGNATSASKTFVGDGFVEINGTGLNNFFTDYLFLDVYVMFIDIIFKNYVRIVESNFSGGGYPKGSVNCRYINTSTDIVMGSSIINNTFMGCSIVSIEFGGNFQPSNFSKQIRNNTFVNCKNVFIGKGTNNSSPTYTVWAEIYNVFKNCNIQYQQATYTDYNLYHNCNFRFNNTAGTQPSLLPEDAGNTYIPSGWIGNPTGSRPTTPAAIQAGQVAAGFAGKGFANSIVQTDYPTDPNFNNISLLDFTLKPTSPARNLAYEGTFVGAKSVGTPLKFRLVEGNGDWLNSASSNLTIIDDSATLTNSANTATIESNVVDLGKDKVLRAISMLGLLGDRNGEWVDSSTDLDSVTTASGSNLLIANQSYVVETGTITYNSVLYQVGQKFAVISGTLDYTPTGGGVVRRIIEAPNRVCYEMRISSISAVDCSAQSYFKYEFEVQPTVNRVGNVGSGAITLGNGEITFNRTPANVFLVSARWIQIRLNVQNNNLV